VAAPKSASRPTHPLSHSAFLSPSAPLPRSPLLLRLGRWRPLVARSVRSIAGSVPPLAGFGVARRSSARPAWGCSLLRRRCRRGFPTPSRVCSRDKADHRGSWASCGARRVMGGPLAVALLLELTRPPPLPALARAAALSSRETSRHGPWASCGAWVASGPPPPLGRGSGVWLGGGLLLVLAPLSVPWCRVLEGRKGVQAKAMPACRSKMAMPSGSAYLDEGVIRSPLLPSSAMSIPGVAVAATVT